ncbi:hypothetical protein HPP92_009096 [Vanilla planifolia]|uniref:Protodermal factor 1 n=1 Tax=Vanilla planifolia TaxID=51239 RepID=A0A835V4D8_VANPL|nr:hypothetical protein HPP92_009096 [Vanilla planifolia]
MERRKTGVALLFCILAVSHLAFAMCRSLDELAEKKNYYSPEPHARSPPHHAHTSPSCQTPSHRSPGGSTPSHGGGSYGNAPPTPSHQGGGGSSGGGGGYYNAPPTAPSNPVVPLNPPSPFLPSVPPSPTTPLISTPPSPPYIPDPNTPGTYYYWGTHPAAIWFLFGYWGTIAQVFGSPATSPFGRNLSLLEALRNTRSDGFGALLREGTASLLNSMVSTRFAFTTQQVREAFNAAMGSEKTAAAQAKLFQKTNEAHVSR